MYKTVDTASEQNEQSLLCFWPSQNKTNSWGSTPGQGRTGSSFAVWENEDEIKVCTFWALDNWAKTLAEWPFCKNNIFGIADFFVSPSSERNSIRRMPISNFVSSSQKFRMKWKKIYSVFFFNFFLGAWLYSKLLWLKSYHETLVNIICGNVTMNKITSKFCTLRPITSIESRVNCFG